MPDSDRNTPAIAKDFFSRLTGPGAIGEGSGVSASETREVPPFDSVELAGSNNVVIRVGTEQSVVVHADDNLLDRVTTEVEDGCLVVDNKNGSFTTRSPMRVDVTMPALDALALSGSGSIEADGIDSEALNVTLSGSGAVNASGTAAGLDIRLSGSGNAELQALVARDVRSVVSGSGRILVTATESIDASVSGTGAITYGGDPPQVTTSITGAGVVTRG